MRTRKSVTIQKGNSKIDVDQFVAKQYGMSSAMILTDENVIIYHKYAYPISHIAVFNEYKQLGINIKDCLIYNDVRNWNINDCLYKTINKFIGKLLNSEVLKTSVSIKCHQNASQFILLDISGQTEDGHTFSFKPSEMIKPQNNFFSEFMDI